MEKIYLGYLSVLIGFTACLPYFYYIWKRQVRPHAFTYFIWVLTASCLALAQTQSGAGSGAWLTYLYALSCILITLLALFYHGQRTIYKIDWACLALALISIGLWIYMKEPLLSILLLTFTDAIGYIPTFVKTYHYPKEESRSLFIMGLFSAGLAIAAMEIYNLETLAYPVTVIAFNLIVIALTFGLKRS